MPSRSLWRHCNGWWMVRTRLTHMVNTAAATARSAGDSVLTYLSWNIMATRADGLMNCFVCVFFHFLLMYSLINFTLWGIHRSCFGELYTTNNKTGDFVIRLSLQWILMQQHRLYCFAQNRPCRLVDLAKGYPFAMSCHCDSFQYRVPFEWHVYTRLYFLYGRDMRTCICALAAG